MTPYDDETVASFSESGTQRRARAKKISIADSLAISIANHHLYSGNSRKRVCRYDLDIEGYIDDEKAEIINMVTALLRNRIQATIYTEVIKGVDYIVIDEASNDNSSPTKQPQNQLNGERRQAQSYSSPSYSPSPAMPPQPLYIQPQPRSQNGIGIAGFILSLLAFPGSLYIVIIGILGMMAMSDTEEISSLGAIGGAIFGGVWLIFVGPMWLLGFIFSWIGIYKKPAGLAIAGFIMSVFPLAVLAILAIIFFASMQ
jgi:hypothetical protein